MSHRHKHHQHHDHHRSNRGGIIAIMASIIVTGGLVALGIANSNSAPATTTAADDGMAGHHTQASGAYTNLDALVGQPSPDFSLTGHDGTIFARDGLRGKTVVLFFNEGMMCYPACWNQIASLAADERFKGDDVVVLSVVVDSSRDWQQAIEKMPELAAATVVHDTGGSVSSRFGMLKTASSMHYGQLPGHSYVVIDPQGVIRHVYDDPNMAIHNEDLADVVATL